MTPGPPLPLTGEQQDYASLITRLETLLEQRPDEPQGLELLATGYMRLGRYAESWRAYERLLAVSGDEAGDQAAAGLYAAMAEAMVQAAGGYVSPAAERAIGEALARDETLLVARYYGGLMMAQSGRIGEAIAVWEQVKAETPAGTPWLEFLDRMLAEAKAVRATEQGPAPGPAPGPGAAGIEAAGAVSPEHRPEMNEGRVGDAWGGLTAGGGGTKVGREGGRGVGRPGGMGRGGGVGEGRRTGGNPRPGGLGPGRETCLARASSYTAGA